MHRYREQAHSYKEMHFKAKQLEKHLSAFRHLHQKSR